MESVLSALERFIKRWSAAQRLYYFQHAGLL